MTHNPQSRPAPRRTGATCYTPTTQSIRAIRCTPNTGIARGKRGADDYAYGVVKRPDGYVSIRSAQGAERGTAPVASRILIPGINVDSAVETLAIIDIGDSRQYETPKHVVGRIPNTSNPGELGNGWLFGHLESPIKGEGNVFQRLPEIPALLNAGDPVYASLLNEDGDEYLYQVTATKVVHQDEIALYDSEDATITLVACVPRLVYDHRLLVTAKLVGVKANSNPKAH